MNAYDWQPWFAWHPARLVTEINEAPGFSYADTGVYAWLRWIERRWFGALAPIDDPQGIGLAGDLADGHWEYRLPRRNAP